MSLPRRLPRWSRLGLCCLAVLLSAVATRAYEKVIFAGSYSDIHDFEAFAVRAQQSGATHIDVTQDLPLAYWELDTPGDPYPSWVIYKFGLLKTTRPGVIKDYVPAEHSERVMSILEERCRVLRRLGLKGWFLSSEPAMLPEAVFTDHPLWRGARVDHPGRSRVARFAPSIDHPEVLELMREGMRILLTRCPEIDSVQFLTNDSGSGLDWSPGLYSGQFGNTLYRNRSMEDRLRGFFDALQAGAADADTTVDLRMTLTRDPDPMRIVRKLTRNMGIENLEGPDGRPYMQRVGRTEGYQNYFNPVLGIPRLPEFVRELAAAHTGNFPRVRVIIADARTRDLYFSIYDRFQQEPALDQISQLQLMKDEAIARVGEAQANTQLAVWTHLGDTVQLIKLLNTGGYIYNLGSIQQRWLVRPFVPFPDEIPAEDKAYYRPFQFQALSEELAETLSDVQATNVYTGWSGRHFLFRVSVPITDHLSAAIRLSEQLGDDDLAHRLKIFQCFVNNAHNAISYQAQLDRVKDRGIDLDPYPVVESASTWDRQMMMETARKELDNTAVLMQLLGDDPTQYLRLAPTKAEEEISLLPPDILDQLQKKLNLMNERWEDYKRLFDVPNW
ncbi:hypothetical protein [Actomonas aquatica]|uniref:Uncharacterized protein n=1 Tax=Actomonas aquatica TaxID=2866162 RepID=A0ABZ1C308_9BACT|nr:hypothetical protein [Opitutus sp. WL0086]WRQ85745.1 hypothetical protein K1X11_013115 [Opitutus sp. WL0086]